RRADVVPHELPALRASVLLLARIGKRYRRVKRLRIRVRGLRRHRVGRTGLHHTTRIEDDHPVAQMTDDIEIVGDEQIAQRELTLKLLQEVENLRLHREIESARRLVEDDELGREHEGSCDRDALPLTPGKLS